MLGDKNTTDSVCSEPLFMPYLQELSVRTVLEWKIIAKNVIEAKRFQIDEILSTGKIARFDVDIDGHRAVLEAFNGYTFLSNIDPSFSDFLRKNGCRYPYFGIAEAQIQGIPHTHKKSSAFNIILEGEGEFEGETPNCRDGDRLIPGKEIHIPKNAVHGHKVITGPLVFFALQECGFSKGSPCEGDFHVIKS